MNEGNQTEMWEREKEEISVATMDEAVTKLRELKNNYDAAKKISSEEYARYQAQQAVVVDLLTRTGKDKYIVQGAGTVSVRDEMSVQTPKSPEDKEKFFDWIRHEMGQDAYYAYMTINSNTLNSLFKQKVEEYGLRDQVLSIDGLSDPVSYKKLSFTK